MAKQSGNLDGVISQNEASISDQDQMGTQANSQNLSHEDMEGDFDGQMEDDSNIDAELAINNPEGGKGGAAPLEIELHDNRQKKPTGIELIKENVKELHEVIAYMDYSFERAFTIQEKEYMLAYKYHAQEIQRDIDAKKPQDNKEDQENKKEMKIRSFQQRLSKIRSAALWLDHVTQMHTDDSKRRRKHILEVEDNMKFLHEKLIAEKLARQEHKKRLFVQRKQFDELYMKAQEFIQTSDDQEKIQELLELLDEEQRSELMSQYREKTSQSQKNKQIVNFTAQSFKKYDNVRVANLVSTVQAHNLKPELFANEIQSYFEYHAERKQNVIDCLRDQVLVQKHVQRKLMEDQQRNTNWLPQKTRNDQGIYHSMPGNGLSVTKPLLALFMEHLDGLKKQLRQRKALTKLQNIKSTKIRADHLKRSDMTQQVTIAQFKAQDKKNLLKNFFGDERVQILVSQLLIKNSGIQVPNQQGQPQPLIQQPQQVIPAQSQAQLRTSFDQVNLASEMTQHLYNSKDPKLNMSSVNIGQNRPFTGMGGRGSQLPERNYSAVMSQKTAASSFAMTQMGRAPYTNIPTQQIMPDYSTAVIGGGGPNIYDRLLNDSTENLLRPTAQMIGSANRVSASFISQQPWNYTKAGRKNPRQLASANIRQRGRMAMNRPTTNKNAYVINNDSAAFLNIQRAFSSQGYRTTINSRRPNAGAMYTNQTMQSANTTNMTASRLHGSPAKQRGQSSNVYYSKSLYKSVYDRQKSQNYLSNSHYR